MPVRHHPTVASRSSRAVSSACLFACPFLMGCGKSRGKAGKGKGDRLETGITIGIAAERAATVVKSAQRKLRNEHDKSAQVVDPPSLGTA